MKTLLNTTIVNKVLNKEHTVIFNKIDLIEKGDGLLKFSQPNHIIVSCKTEYGFDMLINTLIEKLKNLCGTSSEHISMNQARHRQHVTDCLNSLNKFLSVQDTVNSDIILMAEHLRERHLGKLTGTVTSEQILDVIFKDFCIGK